jgi:hypothetical protein
MEQIYQEKKDKYITKYMTQDISWKYYSYLTDQNIPNLLNPNGHYSIHIYHQQILSLLSRAFLI